MRLVLLLVVGSFLAGCRAGPRAQAELEAVERLFDSARYVRDQYNATAELGVSTSVHGVPLDLLERDRRLVWAEVARRAAGVTEAALDSADRRALTELRDRAAAFQPAAAVPSAGDRPPCLGPDRPPGLPLDSLAADVLRCYTRTAELIVVDGDTLDRLTILGLLGTTPSPRRRERLFNALRPVWTSVNGDDGAGTSPYRDMVRLRQERWRGALNPIEERSRRFGIEPAEAERWIVAGLEAWRLTLPDTLMEPWDYYYHGGEAGRRLAARIPRDSLLPLNHRFYRSLGADPESIGVRYDVEPRLGKTSGAFADFGARSLPWGPDWVRSEPWVFASYRIGGLGNLVELLHETGHAVHIAAIRTRPVYHHWPDADLFTEGIADLVSFEAYEPAWQHAFLGDSVPLAASLREKYAAIMLDMAWSLFEIRVHRPGAPSPNAVWTDITTRYLAIRPHPELSWWAMRMQLVESPGYMMNYAIGAFLVADLRARIQSRLGPVANGNDGWYALVSEGLYRFGREVPARVVAERFLGRPPSPDALLADLARIRRPAN